MDNSYRKSILAKSALSLVPPLLRQTLLENINFREEHGFLDVSVLSFNDLGISFRRSDLFDAARLAVSSSLAVDITTLEGQLWLVKNTAADGELPILELSRENQGFVLPDLSALSADTVVRLNAFDKKAAEVNLPTAERDKWRTIIAERELKDSEIDTFFSDFRDTPTETAEAIRREIEKTHINISTLVPPSRKYFERLIGKYDESTNIREYAVNSARTHLAQLSSWDPAEGFLLSLYLSSHSSITSEINVDRLSKEQFLSTLDFIDKSGDRISQLGAIEVGLRIIHTLPGIKPLLFRLIETVCDDVDGQKSGFKLLSALFILVDGELSRTKLFSMEPPFYRRLAALSQAALICRQFASSNIDVDRFCEWAVGNYGAHFNIQSFADMRLEPRWNPSYVMSSQIKADFIGRIMNAVSGHGQEIVDGEVSNLLLAKITEIFQSPSDLVRMYLPGPLEGSEEFRNEIPSDLRDAIQSQLSSGEINPISFAALVNSALLFHVSVDQAELAAKVLEMGSHRLSNIDDQGQLVTTLYGLAIVAAISRSRLLAEEVRILVRRYQNDIQFSISLEDAMKVCLISSASCSESHEWRNIVGDWFTELALSELDNDDSRAFHSHLHYLLHVVPELWVSCGRADAALQAYNSIQNPG
jgi:hypothetical protein